MINIISLGAGVQSSTMALMYACGELTPMPDCAIFADTGGEPKAVYIWLDWLEKQLPFPVHRVQKGDLWKSATTVRRTRDGKRSYIQTAIPAYMKDKDAKAGIGMRHCTMDFKIAVITKKAKELTGLKRVYKKHGVMVNMLIGISTDEADRMKPNRKPWIQSIWPLCAIGMSRADCFVWMQKHGYPDPPRSACTYCPYKSDEAWLTLEPDELADAIQKEKQLQDAYAQTTELKCIPYLHESRIPLSEVKFNSYKKIHPKRDQLNMFRNECDGMCGI